jgi:V8-like Glu-specific endopeptidase
MRQFVNHALVIASLLGCTIQNSEPTKTSALIGKDDRQAVPATDSSRLAIGQFGKGLCTGFFSGPNTITAASHCVKNLKSNELGHLETVDGSRYRIQKIISLNLTNDVATLSTIDSNPKFLASGSINPSAPAELIGWDSFSKDFKLSKTPILSPQSASQGLFTHELDTEGGNSGSPILQDGKVIGMHLGWVGTKSNPNSSTANQSIEKATVVRNIAVNLTECDSANLRAIGSALNLECKWDCSKKCCKRIAGHKVCEPTCKTACETHNGGCDAADEAARLAKILEKKLVKEVAEAVEATTPKSSWTYGDCDGTGARVIVAGAGAVVAEKICGGSSAGLCAGGGAATVAAIHSLVCKQLCVDGHITEGCP